MKKISVDIDIEHYRALKYDAFDTQRTLSTIIRELLENKYSNENKRNEND